MEDMACQYGGLRAPAGNVAEAVSLLTDLREYNNTTH